MGLMKTRSAWNARNAAFDRGDERETEPSPSPSPGGKGSKSDLQPAGRQNSPTGFGEAPFVCVSASPGAT